MNSVSRELSEKSARCLTCACRNRDNAAAAGLLAAAGALTAIGVVAAIFLADSEQHRDLTARARHAIAEQRAWCHLNGAFAENCPIYPPR